jgi:hydroxymethylpyrimidine pyrophosphatase-like HAD family hydrolase
VTRPRVLASDCDGTLLRSDGSVSAYSRRVLAAAAEAGLTVVLVTARPPRWMDDLADLGVAGLALCGNGAFTYDLVRRRIVGHRLLDVDLLRVLLTELQVALPEACFATEGVEGFAREERYERFTPPPENDWRVTGTAVGLADRPVGKVLVRHPYLASDELTAQVAGVVAGRAEVSHSGAVRLTEIGPPGVTKAAALTRWCLDQVPPVGPSGVWAFGDMPNDLPMLRWAGRAHAVANAHRDVLAVADEVVPGNDEDGVARTIDRLLRG